MSPEKYPKVMSRLSTFFGVIGILLGFASAIQICHLVVIYTTLRQGDASTRPLETIVLACSFFAARYVLDYLVIMGDRLEYMERVQEQQSKILTELYRSSKRNKTETETLPS